MAIATAFVFARAMPGEAVGDIKVTTTADELNSDGDCSLREAIQAANLDVAVDACPAGSGADTILLEAATYTLSIPNADGFTEEQNETGDLDILSDIDLQGAGATSTTIDGAGIGRVIDVRSGIVTISDVTVQGGGNVPAPSDGAGIRNFASDVTVTDVTVSGNTAGNLGGGIYSQRGSLTVVRSTVSDNLSGAEGGGIFVGAQDPILEVVNSTISGNVADGNGGGGVQVSASDFFGGGSLSLTNTTITNNTNDGLRNVGDYVISLKNTIIGDQASGNDCDGFVIGIVTTLGNNLDSDDTCGLVDPTDIPNTVPVLGPLQDNGGPTDTHALLDGSPAIDAGDNSACPATDQRGVARPQAEVCDIGAFEREEGAGATATSTSTATPTPTFTPTPTVTPTPSDGFVEIAVNEAIGVADDPSLQNAVVEISVSETVGVADAPELLDPVVQINVLETVGVADDSSLNSSIVEINVSETVGVGDTPSLLTSVLISITEAVGVRDAPEALPTEAEQVSQVASPGETVSTDEGGGATESDPIETSLTTPNGGLVTITEEPTSAEPPDGFELLGYQVSITAPDATPEGPLVIVFDLHPSLIPDGESAETIQVFKDGVLVPDCDGPAGVASPDPCVQSRETLANGNVRLTILTSTASLWTFGVAVCPEDVDADGKVAVRDIVAVAHALGSTPSGPRWKPAADVNADGRVDLTDLLLVLEAFVSRSCD